LPEIAFHQARSMLVVDHHKVDTLVCYLLHFVVIVFQNTAVHILEDQY
jgi:hypothetical protein